MFGWFENKRVSILEDKVNELSSKIDYIMTYIDKVSDIKIDKIIDDVEKLEKEVEILPQLKTSVFNLENYLDSTACPSINESESKIKLIEEKLNQIHDALIFYKQYHDEDYRG